MTDLCWYWGPLGPDSETICRAENSGFSCEDFMGVYRECVPVGCPRSTWCGPILSGFTGVWFLSSFGRPIFYR